MKKPTCAACKNQKTAFFARKNNCDIFRCGKCGLMFVWPIPENYLALYSEDYFSGAENELGYADYEGDKKILSGTFKNYLKRIETILPQKGKLFDVGAATGYFLKLAKENGWQASGIEISEYAASVGRKNGLDIITGNFETYNIAENQFDAVVFWDALEHFAKPDLALGQARKILKPGGLLAINTPDSVSLMAKILRRRWHAIVPPNHLYIFSLKNLTQLLSKNNFEVVETARVGKKFSLRTIFKVLANWQKISILRNISNYFLRSRVGNLSVYLNLRDNIFLVARKK